MIGNNIIRKANEFFRDFFIKYKKLLKFGAVGGLGTIVNTYILYVLTQAGMHYLAASVIATESAIIFNFLGNHVFTFKGMKNNSSFISKFLSFQIISITTIVGTVIILAVLVNLIGKELLLVWNFVAILIMFLANFYLNKHYTWGDKQVSLERMARHFRPKMTKAFLAGIIILILFLAFPVLSKAELHDENITEDIIDTEENESDGLETNLSVTLNTNGTNTSDGEEEGDDIFDDEDDDVEDEEDEEEEENEKDKKNEKDDDPKTSGGETNSTSNKTAGDTVNGSVNETGTSFNESTNNTTAENNQSSETNTSQESQEAEETQGPMAEVKFNDTSKTWQIFETNTIVITQEFEEEETLDWSANGEQVMQTEGTIHTFKWSPGPLFTSNEKSLTIQAEGTGWNQEWQASVEYTINPYFSDEDGDPLPQDSKTAMVNVFTNIAAYDFDSLKITIVNEQGGTEYDLEKTLNTSDETVWKRKITSLMEGNNYMEKAKGTLKNGEEISFDFGKARAHFITPTSSTGTGTGGGGGGGGAGEVFISDDEDEEPNPSILIAKGKPELVYLVFEEDVLAKEDFQTIQLDATNFQTDIEYVSVEIRTPSGKIIEIPMSLDSGSGSYGTWKGRFEVTEEGKHTVSQVILSPPEVLANDKASFYVVQDEEGINKELHIVYSVLSKGTAKQGEEVIFTVDAVDSEGIESIVARISSNRGDSFDSPLEFKQGSRTYGTWEASISANEPDTTYKVDHITLQGADREKTYNMSSRSFYVEASPTMMPTGNVVSQNYPAFSRMWFLNIKDTPLFPTVLAFTLMLLAAFVWAAGYKMTTIGS